MRSERWLKAALVAAALSVLPVSAYAVLETQQQGAVSFVSGGVGEDEIQAIKNMAGEYAFELLFVAKSTPTNEFLSGVQVKVMDKHGKVVLDTESNGPFLLAKLPPGKYMVEASLNGSVQRRSVQVFAGGRKQPVTFLWDSEVAVRN